MLSGNVSVKVYITSHFESADETLFLFSVSAVGTAVLFFFCAGSTGGVVGDTDVDFCVYR